MLSLPDDATTADFFRLCIDCGVHHAEEVVRWADGIIGQSAQPPSWAIDISLCPISETRLLRERLKSVPGQSSPDGAMMALVERLQTLWQAGQVDDAQCADKIRYLLRSGRLPAAAVGTADWIDEVFDPHWDCRADVDINLGTPDKKREALEDFFLTFAH